MIDLQIGREELRPFIVAVKSTDHFPVADNDQPDGQRFWPVEFDDELAAARARYCDGTHEMVQGRADGMTIQYLLPRKAAVPPRPFPMATVNEVFA